MNDKKDTGFKPDQNAVKEFFIDLGADFKEKITGFFRKSENTEKISFKSEDGKVDLKKGFSSLKDWLVYHKTFTMGILLLLVLVIVLVNIRGCGHEYYSASGDIETFKVDKNVAIETLMQDYYSAYASGDATALSEVATPVSDLEKGYIMLLAGYVEEYQDISCYVKSGLEDGSYFVCASMAMKFYGIDTPAPGVETFYVRTDASGDYYIDNVYSTFNLQTQEYDLDEDMASRITSFESEGDVVELVEKVTSEYAEAVAGDEALESMITYTLPNAISNWMTSAVAEQKAAEEAAAEAQAAEEAAAAEAAAQAAAEAQAAEEAEAQAAEEAAAEAEAEEAAAQGESAPNAAQQGYFDEGDVVTIGATVNIRSGMGTDTDLMGTAYDGDVVTVVMSYAEGWTKVKWGTKTGYIRTDVLLKQLDE